jgi:ATP-dependent Clp protease ATP-binding subunit ClpA
MFERFHHDAKAVLARARDEADRDGDGEVGTGHLLLGLLARPGDAADALKAAGASLTELRTRIPRDGSPDTGQQDTDRAADEATDQPAEVATAPDAPAPDATAPDATAPDAPAAGAVEPVRPEDVRLTREARRALERAQKTAQRLKHQRVSTGHVLLGIIDQPDDPTVGALRVVGIRVGTLRADVLRRMETADPGGPGARGTGPGNDPGD